MDVLLIIGIMLLAGIGGFLAFSLLTPRPVCTPHQLVPFSVLPVQDAQPSTKAFLELLAGQIAWMDSSVLQSMVLMYRDGDEVTASMCREMAQQYDFFSCMSLSEAQALLAVRMDISQEFEKYAADGCNFPENDV